MGSGGLIYYEGHFKKYLRKLLDNFIAQGVLHIEARAFLGLFLFHADHTSLTW